MLFLWADPSAVLHQMREPGDVWSHSTTGRKCELVKTNMYLRLDSNHNYRSCKPFALSNNFSLYTGRRFHNSSKGRRGQPSSTGRPSSWSSYTTSQWAATGKYWGGSEGGRGVKLRCMYERCRFIDILCCSDATIGLHPAEGSGGRRSGDH